MPRLALFCGFLCFVSRGSGQVSIGHVGSYLPIPRISSGQVFDLFVRTREPLPAGKAEGVWKESLNGFSVFARFGSSEHGLNLLIGEISNTGSRIGGVGIAIVRCQFPFGIPTGSLREGRILYVANVFAGEKLLDSQFLALDEDSIQLETKCDGYSEVYVLRGGLGFRNVAAAPCTVLFRHQDGTEVTAAEPARVGERLVVRARGLGETLPPAESGQRFGVGLALRNRLRATVDFVNNASPRFPAPSEAVEVREVSASPIPETVGWYQIDFVVPPLPEGKAVPPCDQFQSRVMSNVTVSFHLQESTNGGGFCMTPPTGP